MAGFHGAAGTQDCNNNMISSEKVEYLVPVIARNATRLPAKKNSPARSLPAARRILLLKAREQETAVSEATVGTNQEAFARSHSYPSRASPAAASLAAEVERAKRGQEC